MSPPNFPGLRLPGRAVEAPFQLVCACGAAIRGQRQAAAQSVPCPACGRRRFVLPRSSLPFVTDSPVAMTPGRTTRASNWTRWLAGAMFVLIITLASALAAGIVHRLISVQQPLGEGALTAGEKFERHLSTGRRAMEGGDFHLAARELSAALEITTQLPGRLSAEESRTIRHQQRQAALAADLLSESLTEVIRSSLGMSEEEWQETYRRRYADRSFILDDTLHRDGAGRIHHGYRFDIAGHQARLDLDNLAALQELQWPAPMRVVLGMRLLGMRREKNGDWTIVPEPKSGVFITDRRLVTGLSLPQDAELLAVLKRQEAWPPFAE